MNDWWIVGSCPVTNNKPACSQQGNRCVNHRVSSRYDIISTLWTTIRYLPISQSLMWFRSLRSIWDVVIFLFNTISYIYINSQKATKIRFNSFITGLFSGNIVLPVVQRKKAVNQDERQMKDLSSSGGHDRREVHRTNHRSEMTAATIRPTQ